MTAPRRLDKVAAQERTWSGAPAPHRTDRLAQIIAEMLKEALAFEADQGAV